MNCVVIVSQYRWSRHVFIVKVDKNTYHQNALKMIEELETYKRSSGDTRPFDYGDMADEYFKGAGHQYNVNDSGDIYFISKCSVNAALHDVYEYWETSRREANGYKKKAYVDSIYEHHNKAKIKEIVAKYFELI